MHLCLQLKQNIDNIRTWILALFQALKKVDENVIICLTTADHNYLKSLKSLIAIDIIVLYKPIFLKDLKNKIDSLLVNYTLLKN